MLIIGYLAAESHGGYRIRIEQEIQALASNGCDVHFAVLHPQSTDQKALGRRELESLGCTVHLIPCEHLFDVHLDESIVRDQLDALQELVERYDLHVIHAEALYCARLGLLLKQRCSGLRLVFDCHGTTPEEERMSNGHGNRVSAMESWERRVLCEADLNVFVSVAMHEFYQQRYGGSESPHVIVPCCVAEERFPAGVQPTLAGLPVDRPIVAYLGTIAAWQCGEELIRLFADLYRHDNSLFFLLLIPQSDHKKTRDWMWRHGLPASCVLLAELPHNEIAANLQAAHASVLLRRPHPVNQVSSPTKFGEYLAAGVPVIMTEGIGDFSDMATTCGVGLVLDSAILNAPRIHPTEVNRILKFVHESVDERERIASRCRNTARLHLHWKSAIAKLLDGYRDLNREGADIHRNSSILWEPKLRHAR